MTEPDNIFEKLEYFFKGDAFAVAFAMDVLWLAHYVDDLYDGDVPRGKEEAKQAFKKVFCDMPQNPFFLKHQKELSALMASAYLMWCDSTHFERGDAESRFIAFQIRNATLNVVHHCIYLCGGSDWAEQNGPDFWRNFAPRTAKWIELKHENPEETQAMVSPMSNLERGPCHENVS
jgi:hypothetical protein